MKLYSINENDIKILIKENIQIKTIGKYEIIANLKKFTYPLKAIIEIRETDIFIITCYPLKRARNEN